MTRAPVRSFTISATFAVKGQIDPLAAPADGRAQRRAPSRGRRDRDQIDGHACVRSVSSRRLNGSLNGDSIGLVWFRLIDPVISVSAVICFDHGNRRWYLTSRRSRLFQPRCQAAIGDINEEAALTKGFENEKASYRGI